MELEIWAGDAGKLVRAQRRQLWGRTLLRLEQPRGKAGLPSGSISRGRPVRVSLGPGAWGNVATGQLLFATCPLPQPCPRSSDYPGNTVQSPLTRPWRMSVAPARGVRVGPGGPQGVRTASGSPGVCRASSFLGSRLGPGSALGSTEVPGEPAGKQTSVQEGQCGVP